MRTTTRSFARRLPTIRCSRTTRSITRRWGNFPEALRRAFLDGEWDVYAGQYFDIFAPGRHTVRPEQVQLEPWTPRWISIDWGFEHPSAVYWHATRNDGVVVTYREFVQNRLSPRMLAAAIAERSVDRLGRAERIRDVFLSPDAFAQRTADASIAEQLGDGLAAAGLPRPTSGRQRPRGRLDADVPGAGKRSLADRRKLHAPDREFADADARSRERRGHAEVRWRRSRRRRALRAEVGARTGPRSGRCTGRRARHGRRSDFARDLAEEIFGGGVAEGGSGGAAQVAAARVVGQTLFTPSPSEGLSVPEDATAAAGATTNLLDAAPNAPRLDGQARVPVLLRTLFDFGVGFGF